MTPTPSFRDVKILSAYLDGQLKSSEIAPLEARLQIDPELASALKDLREARGILRILPLRRAPRNFTLTPKMVGVKPPLPRSYPAFRMASVLATLLFFFTFATNFMAPRFAQTTAPFVTAIGDAGAEEPEMAMDMAAEEPAAPAGPADAAEPAPAMEESIAPTASPAPTPPEGASAATDDDSARIEATTQPSEKSGVQGLVPGETYAQEEAPDEALQIQPALPFGGIVRIIFAAIAILSALIALIIRFTVTRKWRERAK